MIYLILFIFALMAVFLMRDLKHIFGSIRAQGWKTCAGELEDWKLRTEVDSEDSNFYVDSFRYSYSVGG